MEHAKASSTKSLHFPQYDDEVVRLNTGSLGAVVGPALAAQNQFRDWFLTDTGPHRYHFTGRLGPEIQDSLQEVVSMFQECREVSTWWEQRWCFVQNATTAAAIVGHHWQKKVRAAAAQRSSFLIVTDCIFGPIKRCFEEHLEEVVIVELQLLSDTEKGGRSIPQTKAEIIKRFERELVSAVQIITDLSHGTAANIFCCLEYIPCVPAILFPVPNMISKVKDVLPDSKIFVDAAQMFLEQDLSFRSLLGNPDFAVINLYKWNFAPVGSSILYFREEDVNHVVPSWTGGMSHTGWYTGLRDYSAYIATKHAIQVRYYRDLTSLVYFLIEYGHYHYYVRIFC